MSEFRLSIGGFTFSVSFLEDYTGIMHTAPYRRFLSENGPDVFVRFHARPLSSNGPRQIIFDSGSNWSLCRSDGQYLVRTMFQEAVCSQDFRSADVYMIAADEEIKPILFGYPLDELLMINLLCRNQGILLHACGISDRGEGILFCGMSGAGKSTLANIWKAEEGVVVLGDDRIVLRMIDGDLMICGTPWHGEARHCSPEMVPVRKIFIIEHAKENLVKNLSRAQAVSHILPRSFVPIWDKAGMARTLEFADTVTAQIPAYSIGVVPDRRVVEFARSI